MEVHFLNQVLELSASVTFQIFPLSTQPQSCLFQFLTSNSAVVWSEVWGYLCACGALSPSCCNNKYVELLYYDLLHLRSKTENFKQISFRMAQNPTSSALRALALEFKSLQEEPVEGFRVKLVSEENLFEWEVAIFGPPKTLYEGGYFKVRISFLSIVSQMYCQ